MPYFLNNITSINQFTKTTKEKYFVDKSNLIGKMSGHVEGSQAFKRYRKIEDSTLRDVINQLG